MSAALLLLASCRADEGCGFSVATPFSSHMVLAKDRSVQVFGEGCGRVCVSIDGHTSRAKAHDGRWSVTLPAMPAGGPYTMTVRSGGEKVVFDDVMVGRVILAAGQSNMKFKLHESSTPKEEWADDPMLREYTVDHTEDDEPHCSAEGWIACTAEDAGNWSALAYHIGMDIRRRTGEAVGIVNCYQGASIIEAWIPAGTALKECYVLPAEELHVDHTYPGYEKFNQPGLLYEKMVSRIAPYTMSDVVWYQGESNTGKGEYRIYPQLACELVNCWRNDFLEPDLPFVFVQIADYRRRPDEAWKNLQDAQMLVPSMLEGVTAVRSADVCEDDNIHPRTKSVLADRIADVLVPEEL